MTKAQLPHYRYVAERDEDMRDGSWLVWDRDTRTHCGIGLTPKKAIATAEKLNKKNNWN